MKSTGRIARLPEGVTSKQAKLKLTTQYATHAGNIPTRPQFRRWIKATLMRDAEIVLRIVDEPEARGLNRDFRDRDYATNVLTFVYSNGRPLSGDIVLCAPVVEKEARQQHKHSSAHYAHLTVHGALHLQGYSHESDASAAVMEQLETGIIMRMGYDDPYKEDPPAREKP
ncbi:MAG: rRNA maturation RNase YbeY [Nitrosospira sp.]|nr:rRNA maturation RNase YbeY [Nitrosospira sp.]